MYSVSIATNAGKEIISTNEKLNGGLIVTLHQLLGDCTMLTENHHFTSLKSIDGLIYCIISDFELPSSHVQSIHNYVLSLLTQTRLKRALTQNPAFDVGSWISGSENLIPTKPLLYYHVLPITTTSRSDIQKQFNDIPSSILFGILIDIPSKSLAATFPSKHVQSNKVKYHIYPNDMGILLHSALFALSQSNTVPLSSNTPAATSSSVMASSPTAAADMETWSPICLPSFDSSRFLFLYTAYINPSTAIALVASSQNSFEICSQFKTSVYWKLPFEIAPPLSLPTHVLHYLFMHHRQANLSPLIPPFTVTGIDPLSHYAPLYAYLRKTNTSMACLNRDFWLVGVSWKSFVLMVTLDPFLEIDQVWAIVHSFYKELKSHRKTYFIL